MKVTQVKLSSTCHLERVVYGGIFSPEITLEYVEHSSDSYYPNNDTSLVIDNEKAIEIIKFLEESFNL